jgi:hypothetical protein
MKKILCALVIKKLFVVVLAFSMLAYEQRAYAQAAPVANFVVNRAIASAVQRVAIARGFAANDPRIAATLSGMGKSSTSLNVVSTVAGVGLAVAGAPVWLGIAASLGIVGVGYGIKAWVDNASGGQQLAEVKIASTPTGNQLQVDAPVQPLPTYQPVQVADTTPRWAQALMQGAPLYRSPYSCYSNEACYALPLPPEQPHYRYTTQDAKIIVATTDVNQLGYWWTFLNGNGTQTRTVWDPETGTEQTYTQIFEYQSAQANVNSSGQSQITVYVRDARTGGDAYGLPSYDRVNTYNNAGSNYGDIGPKNYPSLDQAVAALQQQIGTAKISPESLARLVDQIWQRAAQDPNYQGLPYSFADPVTQAELQPWAEQNPMAVPTVADMLAPASNPGTNEVPVSPTAYPGTNPAPGTDPVPSPGTGSNVNVVNTPNVNVVNKISVDLGADPGIQSPDLEQSPEAWQIFDPVMQSVSSMFYFGVPNHPSECPKPSFDMFGKTILMDGHCNLLDSVKPTLFSVMGAVWVCIGVFIILAA